MSQNKLKPTSRKNDIVIQELDKEILVYDLTTHKAVSLNETSALVWQACDGSNTINEIAVKVSKKVNSPISEDFVWLALEQLKKEDLLENEFAFSAPFAGLTRREVIRRVGYATMAAIPVIASLVAPSAAHAQSNCFGDNNANKSSLGCTCNSSNDCSSNCCGTDGTTATCVTPALDPNGSACRVACECAGNCCAGNICYTAKAFPMGTSCVSACQCKNTCSMNVCT